MQFEKEDAANAATIESSANLDDANRTEHHNTKKTTVSEVNYPSPVKLAFIILSLTLAVFLYGLDQTIIATAIPKITDEFDSLDDVGWYGASYLLTSSAFQLLWGKLFTIFSVKIAYLSAVAIFELGSLICAIAPNSVTFIVGRAIAGIGAAGVYSGSVIVLTHTAPLEKRPVYTGLLGASVGVASVVGPFLGGAFADNVTWRWCFYINLPLGAITIGVVTIFVHVTRDQKYASMSILQYLKQLDFPGFVTLVPAIICLLLALQWGGTVYHWKNARIVTLLVLMALLFVAFGFVQKLTPQTRTIPSSIFQSRSIGFTTFYAGCTFSLFVVMVYYLPIWFQGVQQVSALDSGVRIMPLILGFIIFAMLSGALTSVTGYYTPFMITSSIMISIALGLLSTLRVSTPRSQWIGYQAFFGFGVGTGIQQPLLVIQTVLPEIDVPVGTALITLTQSLFGSVFIAVAQNVFENELASRLATAAPGLNVGTLLSGGATTAIKGLPPDKRTEFLAEYSRAITNVFYIAVALGSLSIIGALGTEWRSMKTKKQDEERESCEGTESRTKATTGLGDDVEA